MLRRVWIDKAAIKGGGPCIVVATAAAVVKAEQVRGRAFSLGPPAQGPVVNGQRVRVWLETHDPVEALVDGAWREV